MPQSLIDFLLSKETAKRFEAAVREVERHNRFHKSRQPFAPTMVRYNVKRTCTVFY